MQKALLSELEGSFRRGDAARRGEIVRRIGMLFVSGAKTYSEEQVELFGEVLARLVEEIEVAARAELSRSLCEAPVGPAKLMRRLALDRAIEVAEPLLAGFGPLDEDVQVECASLCGQQHLMALTRRRSLSEAVTAPLVARGDSAVLRSVVANPGAAFSNGSYGTLVERSTGDDELGMAIGARPDLPRHHFLRLLQVASDLVRNRLQAADPQNAGAIQKIVSQVAGSIAARTMISSDQYDEAVAQVGKLHRAGKLDDSVILRFLTHGRTEHAVAALACLAKQEIGEVEAVLRQERIEAVVILARALGLSWSTTKALLNLQADIAALPLSQVERALAMYERTSQATAEKVLTIKRRSKRPNDH